MSWIKLREKREEEEMRWGERRDKDIKRTEIRREWQG